MDYDTFLAAKAQVADEVGVPTIDPADINPMLKPHQRDAVLWAVRGGRRAVFASFGLGKTIIQLEAVRLTMRSVGPHARGLIVLPLGVRQEFVKDARMIGIDPPRFVRSHLDATGPGMWMTNYESIREGKFDPTGFDVVSLDEAAILRGFGGTKTFRELMRLYEGSSAYRFVATATPSPNDYIELLAYAAFLDVLDVGQAKTRFFKRDSEHADRLTLLPHMEHEFWMWVASWALFISKPSDLGYPDDGYELPELEVVWHQIPAAQIDVPRADRDGRVELFRDASLGVVSAAAEKRASIDARVAKAREIVADADDGEHFILWHDQEAERHAIQKALPEAVSVWGAQDLDEREARILAFEDGACKYLSTKPVIAGSGTNLQYHCARAIFVGIGFKFSDFVQAVHRLHRFGQTRPVRIDLIYTDAEAGIRANLEEKWRKHERLVDRMTAIIREHGTTTEAIRGGLRRTGVPARRVHIAEARGLTAKLVLNDSVQEVAQMDDDSVGQIITSIPFSTQYEYSPSVNDFGHNADNTAFWGQMDYLTPELLRVLQPGRVAAIHVKDRIVPGGINGLGFRTLHPFHAEALAHYQQHGFAFLGMITVVTDVVRENNQTYRLAYSEQCKDGSSMGVGVPEYVLILRKPQTDQAKGYADERVTKDDYTLGRWQVDAHGFWRTPGNRHLTPDELAGLTHAEIFRLFRDHNLNNVYDYGDHVALGDHLRDQGKLPVDFMLLQPPSWHPDVWTDVARMRTLNMIQSVKGKEQHLCLARGSLVLTKGDGYKPIETVTPGDLVLTHMGRWRPVLATQKTGDDRAVVTVRAQGVPGATMTPDHKVWARDTRGFADRSFRTAKRQEPGWVEVAETVGSYVNRKLAPVEAPEVGDAAVWWMAGRWLADGHIDKRDTAIVSVGRGKRDEFEAHLDRFGGNPPRDGSALQYPLRDPGRVLRDILTQCGHGAAGKHLPAVAFTLPAEQASALLDGYLSGDGHYREDRHRWMASSVSKPLLLGIAYLAHRVHGATASVYPGRPERDGTIDGRDVHMSQDWILSFDLPGDRAKRPAILGDGAWLKVRSAEPAGVAETWNLRVEEDESYTAEGMVVKNCPLQTDIVDRLIRRYSNPGELVYDPFGGLGTVPVRALKLGRKGRGVELNPGYFLDAVKYLEAQERERDMPSLFDLDEDAAA